MHKYKVKLSTSVNNNDIMQANVAKLAYFIAKKPKLTFLGTLKAIHVYTLIEQSVSQINPTDFSIILILSLT